MTTPTHRIIRLVADNGREVGLDAVNGDVERSGRIIGRVNLEPNGEWSFTDLDGRASYGYGSALDAATHGWQWLELVDAARAEAATLRPY